MKRILIVDDSETARMFIRKCMEIAGCRDDEFYEAPDGEKAIAFLRNNPVDLVVTDLNMPLMNGVELLKKVRESDSLRSLPVLVISSTQNRSKEAELEAFQFTKVLGKPVSPAKMLEALKSLQS